MRKIGTSRFVKASKSNLDGAQEPEQVSDFSPRVLDKRGQVTIFVIIAIVILAGVAVYFLARGNLGVSGIPTSLEPVFNYYTECIKEETKTAIELAGSQGGYVETPPYVPGSDYAPFSSQLNFLGFPVPYWYYISGNGLIKEQAPSKGDIERGIAGYVEERVRDCKFDNFYSQGFDINLGESSASVRINDESVDVTVDSGLAVSKGSDSGSKGEHRVSVSSKLGKFYGIATKIYEKEKSDAIFDNYGVDVLRLYAPVDGVEISCSGKIWKTAEVLDYLKQGLEANVAAIKFKGNYYTLNDKKEKYYEVDLGESVDESVNLLYLKDMPTKIEINGEGVDDALLIASPVGIQEGLGVMGFCYSPYHFVYDMSFPILVQVYNSGEMFQFPIVAIIDKNVAREAVFSEREAEEPELDLCKFETQDIEINLYDSNLNKIDANVSYQCFSQKCNLGESKDGKFKGKAPSCLNGYLMFSGGNIAEKKILFSTNKENVADVILDREREVELELRVGGKALEGTAIVSFAKEEGGESVSAALPEANKIKLSEGSYDISVYVYGNSSITIPASTKTQCQDMPRAGILGFFGAMKEQCFDISIPETKIEYGLRGGGKGTEYILASQLESGKLTIDVDELPIPKSLEELQYNYAEFESKGVRVI